MTASVIATIADTSVRYKRLCLAGRDVLIRGANHNWSVPLETIRLTEEGPGGVSSLSFSVWDPDIAVTLQTGQDVEFWDIERDRPLFLGFIGSFAIRPVGVARYLDIDVIGIEVLLDWMLVPALTIPAGTHFAAAIQSLVANATGVGWPVRAFSHPAGSEDPQNSQAYPVAGYSSGYPTTQYAVTIDGDSLRNAIQTVVTACDTWVIGTGALATIDFYSGLRVFPTAIGTGDEAGLITTYTPTDVDLPSIDMNAGSVFAPSRFSFAIDSASVTRAVYVLGANAAGSGLISDGSGIVGPVAFINDSSSTTATIRNAIGAAYLSQFSQSIRGTLDFDKFPTAELAANYRPGGTWFFSDNVQVFSATIGLTCFSISKTFMVGGHESWSVAVGGFKGSAAKQVKRLTRTQRN